MRVVQILIVEREEGSLRLAEDDLRGAGFSDVARCRVDRAVIETSRGRPELVLMACVEPGSAGVELCRTIKGTIEPEFVPVLMLTAEDPCAVVGGFESGADDCIHWPYDVGEMLARVRSMLRIKNLHDELRVANARLRELSTRDGLTGLYNRRYLFERLAVEVERAVRYQQWLSCIMIDMDALKPVNDEHGHLVGDELLRRAARIFRAIPRSVDIVARYGGDEVVALLPASGLESACNVGHRLCDTMAGETFTVGDRDISMTVSVGVASLDPRNPITADQLVHRADLALYASKHAGGNLVTSWQPGMTDEPET